MIIPRKSHMLNVYCKLTVATNSEIVLLIIEPFSSLGILGATYFL